MHAMTCPARSRRVEPTVRDWARLEHDLAAIEDPALATQLLATAEADATHEGATCTRSRLAYRSARSMLLARLAIGLGPALIAFGTLLVILGIASDTPPTHLLTGLLTGLLITTAGAAAGPWAAAGVRGPISRHALWDRVTLGTTGRSRALAWPMTLCEVATVWTQIALVDASAAILGAVVARSLTSGEHVLAGATIALVVALLAINPLVYRQARPVDADRRRAGYDAQHA